MKTCLIIPCYNHANKLQELIDSSSGLPVIVVDDGSNPPIEAKNCKILRLNKNSGKATALSNGFAEAERMGFDHAITIDADGQHDPIAIPQFISASQKFPDAIITGVRNFDIPGISKGRRFMNKFSNFWFRSETGIDIKDSQCGYRCYPLEHIKRISASASGYVYELEILVKFAWSGGHIEQIEIPTIYSKETLEGSHYRPFADTFKFTMLNIRLFFASKLFTKNALKRLSTR